MADNDERFLHKNIDEVRQNVELMPEMKIINAMKNGIAAGKKRKKRRIYTTSMGFVAASIIGLSVTFSTMELPANELAQPSVQSTNTLNTSDFKTYRNSTKLDPALKSALEQNLVMPVAQSAENKGYRIDVTGAVTDGRKVYVLYTVTNHTDKDVAHANFTLQFAGIKDSSLHKGAQLTMLPGESNIRPGQSKDFVYSNSLSPSVKYPKMVNYNITLTETSDQALLSSTNKYRTSLDVAFKLDTEMLKAQERILNIDRTLNVGGQKIKATRVQFTPLSTYVDLEYDQTNDKEILQLISPVLINNQGVTKEKYEYPSVINSDESNSTLVFRNSREFQKSRPESILLKTLGIRVKENGLLRFFVDLNEEQLRGVSVSGLELEITKSKDGGIYLRHKVAKLEDFQYTYTMPDTFSDAHGKMHKWATINFPKTGYQSSSSQEGSSANEFGYNFGAEAKDYPQPLTFTIEKFSNTIMDTQAVELYTK